VFAKRFFSLSAVSASLLIGAAALAHNHEGEAKAAPASANPAVSNGAASANGAAPAPWVPPGTPGSPIDGTVFHAQVLLDAAGFPSGVIDGKKGMVFEQAVKGFQQSRNLPVTGELDGATRQALLQLQRPSTRMLRLTANDVRGPFVFPFPEDAADQAKLDGLHYRNALEQLAERFHTTPQTIVALNGPDKVMKEGTALRLPNVLPGSRDYAGGLDEKQGRLLGFFNVDANQPKGDFIVVDESEGVMRVYEGEVPKGNKLTDTAGKLVAQFPVTMGSEQYPLPIGRWKVTTYAFEPPFKYQPKILKDKDPNEPEQMLPPGPNGPVGVAWLDLTKEHYGIHGTDSPETIGRAESSGCIRLANWDVIRLSRIMKPGFTAIFQA
jgi:lipoprotein-anchoring transpeptidase ErfK/SrfK